MVSTLESKLARFGKKLGSAVGGALDTVKEASYKTAAKVEDQLANRTGVVGTAAKVVDAAKAKHNDIQSRGGYGAVIEQRLDRYAAAAESLFSGSVFDGKKAEDFVRDKESCVKTYGTKAYNTVVNFLAETKRGVAKNYRDLVPSAEERSTIYAGIGSAYENKIFFRPDLDACSAFYQKASKTLPKASPARDKVLADIKASVSADGSELLQYYKSLSGSSVVNSKVSAVKKYLI